MRETTSDPIPMAILTGYLGAGKTTLLNNILNADHGLKIAVLVNDFGTINIDAQLIVGVEGEAISLSNGCICCTIRGDLVAAIESVINREDPPEYIVIEASGVSDPSQVVLTFNRSSLRSRVRIDSIIAVVDTEQLSSVGAKPRELLHEQIRVSDIIILNKADLVSPEELSHARQIVSGIVDRARIIEATHCRVPIQVLIGAASYNPQTAFDTGGPGVHAHDVDSLHDHEHSDHSIVFVTWSWQTDDAIVLNEMRRVLDNLPAQIMRAKGILYAAEIPDKQVVLQVVGRRVVLTEGEAWGARKPNSSIVLIGEPGTIDKTALQATFDSTREIDSSRVSSPGRTLVDGILSWFRPK